MLVYLKNFQLYPSVWLASSYSLDKRCQIFLPIQQDPHSHIHEIQVPGQYFAPQVLMLVLVIDFLKLVLMLSMLGLLYYFVLYQKDYFLYFHHSYFDLEVMKGVDQVVDLVDDLRNYFLDYYYHHHHHCHHSHLVTPLVSYQSLFDTQSDTLVVFHLTGQMEEQ